MPTLMMTIVQATYGQFSQDPAFFAAAQENKDFEALCMGPSMPSKYKLFVDTKNLALEISGFEVSKFLHTR